MWCDVDVQCSLMLDVFPKWSHCCVWVRFLFLVLVIGRLSISYFFRSFHFVVCFALNSLLNPFVVMLKNANHHRCEWTVVLIRPETHTERRVKCEIEKKTRNTNNNNIELRWTSTQTYPDFSSFKWFYVGSFVILLGHCVRLSIAFKVKSTAESWNGQRNGTEHS